MMRIRKKAAANLYRWPVLSAALLGILALPFLVQPAKAVESPRLAIVAEDKALAAAVDLLTVEFSTNSQIALLERAQIDKVLAEQSLSAVNGGDVLKLGQLLGADGLLVLQTPEAGDRPELIVTLVAVKPGVVLQQTPYEWPTREPERWAELVARQMRDLLPKIAVLPKDALPVSILNLRASVSSPEAATLERELTRLLYDRLVREREIFVLERRRLQVLAGEKEMRGLADVAFWSGGYLLEGIINKGGYNTNTITVSGSIMPPDKSKVIMIEISGARTNLANVINDLATRILSAVKRNGVAAEWNPGAEADRYHEEAQWAFRWGMFKEACAAGEASWVLGRQTKEAAELRIKAYRESGGHPGECIIDTEQKRVIFGQPFNPRIHDLSQIAAFAVSYDSERFADMARALELYSDGLRVFAAPDSKLDGDWFTLGSELIDRMAWWLRYYYFTVEARAGTKEKVSAVRRLSREIVEALSQHSIVGSVDTNFIILKARHSAFWVDTPEQGLSVYREILTAGHWPLVRTRFLNAAYTELRPERIYEGISGSPISAAGEHADLASPPLVGWTWEDRKRCPTLWSGFIGELCASTNPLVEIEGSYLRCSFAWSEEDYERNLQALLDLVWARREAVAGANLADGLLRDLRTLVEGRANELSISRRKRIAETIWTGFERDFAKFQGEHAHALAELKAEQARVVLLEARKNYLKTQAVYDFPSFTRLLHDNYKTEEAKQMLPLLADYKKRVAGTNTTAGRDRSAQFFIDQLEQKLVTAISPPQSTNASMPSVVRQPQRQRFGAFQGGTDPRSLVYSNVLQVTRFWKVPETHADSEHATFAPRVASCCFRDGSLWVDVRYSEHGSKRADFMRVDLDTFRVETVEYEDENYDLPFMPFAESAGRFFEIHGGYLYLCLIDTIRRYSFKSRKWESFSLPSAGRARPTRVGNRLFFTTDTSILEHTPDGAFRVLASSRRRPAVTALDLIGGYGAPPLFLSGGGNVNACIAGGIYALSADASDWQHVGSMPGASSKSYAFEDGILSVSVRPYEGVELWKFRGSDSAPELLFRQPPPPQPGRWAMPGRKAQTNAPRWALPDGIWIVNHSVSVQDDCVWFLVGPLEFQADTMRRARLREVNGRHALLLRYQPGDDEPIRIPVRFAPDSVALPPNVVNASLNSLFRQEIFQSTPKGLVVSHGLVPGLWFIPKSDLERRVESGKAEHRQRESAAATAREKLRGELIAAYDKDRSGVFGDAEKEAMIDDWRFIELEIPGIDANRNGLLDADELRFFDVNGNGTLDPKEQNGIDIALTNLVLNLIAKLDYDKNGKLEPAELPEDLLNPAPPPGLGIPAGSTVSVATQGMDEDALVHAVREKLMNELRIEFRPGMRLEMRPGFPPSQRLENVRETFKASVEEYWRKGQQPQPAIGTRAPVPPQTKNPTTSHLVP